MRFLFDENLSPRLVGEVGKHWPDSSHIEAFGLRRATDDAIWTMAKGQGFTIVSKDDDFCSLALVQRSSFCEVSLHAETRLLGRFVFGEIRCPLPPFLSVAIGVSPVSAVGRFC